MQENKYKTDELPFSAYLHTTKRLRFLGVEPASRGRILFLFEDPKGEGEALFLAFLDGAEVPAASFYEKIRLLRKIMSRSGEERESPHRR